MLANYAKRRCEIISQFPYPPSAQTPAIAKGFAENTFWNYNYSSVNCDLAVNAWYSEAKYYNYSNTPSPRYAQFTQLIWAITSQQGCAVCGGKHDGAYYVCVYMYPGNINGQFERNVNYKK